MDRRIIKAASNALGYDVDEDRIAQAEAAYRGLDTKALRRELREKTEIFEASGSRGIELADEIDSIRIALAARRVVGEGHDR